jgi:glycolate oxidase
VSEPSTGGAGPTAVEPVPDVVEPIGSRPLPGMPADPARGAAFLAALAVRLPGLSVRTEPTDLEAHRCDETANIEPPLPIAVVAPASTGEVAEIVRLAAAYRVPIVPRGEGTGLSGGAAAVEGGLVMTFRKMASILSIDEADLTSVVQPGIINAAYKTAVAERGLFYPPDPASYETCSLGGNVGTNAGGLCCVKYGVTRESVATLEVVLADGSVIRTARPTVKDAAGYDLTRLMVGSQGTLGIVTEITVRLRPTPPPKMTMLAFFSSLAAAGDAVSRITAAKIIPCTLEMMDGFTIRAAEEFGHFGFDTTAAAMLMVESDAPGAAAGAEVAIAEQACVEAGSTFTVASTDPGEADMLRQGRRQAYYALERLGVARMEDVAVPRSRMAELVAAVERVLAEEGMPGGTFGHVGDGNLHPTFIVPRDDPSAAERIDHARHRVYAAAIELGGTVTGEHGIGLVKRDWLEATRGEGSVRAMRAIKAGLDPLGIMNPGKILPD